MDFLHEVAQLGNRSQALMPSHAWRRVPASRRPLTAHGKRGNDTAMIASRISGTDRPRGRLLSSAENALPLALPLHLTGVET